MYNLLIDPVLAYGGTQFVRAAKGMPLTIYSYLDMCITLKTEIPDISVGFFTNFFFNLIIKARARKFRNSYWKRTWNPYFVLNQGGLLW